MASRNKQIVYTELWSVNMCIDGRIFNANPDAFKANRSLVKLKIVVLEIVVGFL
jgi:hypothetical protein